jgi:hypothetical protein
MSFKASKAYEQVQSRFWGLDGLRHIVQPFANFSLVHVGDNTRDILLFDRQNRSTQRAPIDFPQFNTVDSIDSWNILRLGVRHRLQTRRDQLSVNWLELTSFFDVNFERPDFGSIDPDPGTFSNVVNRLRWTPLPWLAFTMDSQLPLLDSGFTEVNTRLNFMLNDAMQLNVGHRYLDNNALFRNSSQIDVGGYLRLGENWGFSFQERYEFTEGVLDSQRYELHRDLSSWIASLGILVRDNDGVRDLGILLSFTLRDLPKVRLPLNFDPAQLGGGGGR